MNKSISIELPMDLGISLKMNDTELAYEVKKLAILKLYELGKISSGMGSKALQISRIEFLELLGKYQISYLDTVTENDIIEEFNV